MERNPPAAAPRESSAAADAPAVLYKEGVDLRRPLVGQMASLGAAYDAWVHRPVAPQRPHQVMSHVPDGDRDGWIARRWPESLRMFKPLWLERMSHIPWWMIPLVWLPIVVGLILLAALPYDIAGWRLVFHVFGGILLWTLAEYVLHRFLFHYKPKSGAGRALHFVLHGVHHLDPWDRTRLVFPPLGGVLIMSTILGVVCLVVPLGSAFALMGGFVLGYIGYDMTHYYAHHGRPRTRWGKAVKAWHLAHHHRDWDAMYGVSSPLWDMVFRTLPGAAQTRRAQHGTPGRREAGAR